TLWNHSPGAVVKETVRKLDARMSVPVVSLADLIAVRMQAEGMPEAAAREAAGRRAGPRVDARDLHGQLGVHRALGALGIGAHGDVAQRDRFAVDLDGP
ncbi:hypothetical protein ACNF5F_25495, partial [Escherichia coli]|uniref:hypothetical protein n=1 Tax=Escherichia coli TaxID=562 RepID=UPI003BA3CD51